MTPPPTVYDWLGGMAALEKLTATFDTRVPDHPLLAPAARAPTATRAADTPA